MQNNIKFNSRRVAKSQLHRQAMSQILISVPESESSAAWSTQTPTPGSLPRLQATPTQTPNPTLQPWLKRYGIQISLDMNLEISSQVGHSRYGFEIFREDVNLFIG